MKTIIHVKTDKQVKEDAQALASKLGLSLSHVVNASLRNFIRDRTVVFTDAYQMTPELEKLLDRVEEDIKHNRNISPAFKSAQEMDVYLNSL